MPRIEPGPLDESKYAISVLRSHQIVLALFHWIELDDKVQNINAEKLTLLALLCSSWEFIGDR